MFRSPRLRLEPLEDRCVLSTAYLATDLIADQPGVAAVTDPTLVNAWGISLNPAGGAFWVSANGTGLSEVYGGDVNGSPLTQPFKVATPGGTPTGQVFNNTTDFVISDGTNTRVSAFIFASESGAITAWNPAVGATPGTPPPSRNALVGFQATDGAIYTGLALGKVGTANFLFAADFHNGKIDVLDGQFDQVTLGTNGFETFTDPNLPGGYAPFNVALIGGQIYVSYAKQDAGADDAVTGRGNGFISVFDTNGHFVKRLVSRGELNAPWGMVQATASFGDFSNALLVGNFGSGQIKAYDPATGKLLGTLAQERGKPIVIDGLWGLAFGNGRTAGDANSLYYAAGPDDETHGLFGKITANPAGTNPVRAALVGTDLIVTGSRNSDLITVAQDRSGRIIVRAGLEQIGSFDAATVGTVRVAGLAGDDLILVEDRVTLTAILDGGAGNDLVIGGGGSNVVLGGIGRDILFAGRGRDVLIGGADSDLLLGDGGDDILIGGSTAHDANQAALLQILGVWNSTDPYATRVANLRAGTGAPKLDSTTVIDDAVGDNFFGGGGLDWYLGSLPDRIFGLQAGELFN
jgi:uncharacterized protein (TIGR03118 family)